MKVSMKTTSKKRSLTSLTSPKTAKAGKLAVAMGKRKNQTGGASTPKAEGLRRVPPKDYTTIYPMIHKLRAEKTADVDRIGCNMLADPGKDSEYQHLLAAMLSSQTKDSATSQAMQNLKAKGRGELSVKKVLGYSVSEIDDCIKVVGFHNTKASNIAAATQMLKNEFSGRVPSDLESLLRLPGVGPKMAYLVLQEAFGKRDSGICVDVHVHRLCNRLGWTNSKTPEETRTQLEAWLPVSEWKGFNPLIVGLGQLLQTNSEYLLRRALKLDGQRGKTSKPVTSKFWAGKGDLAYLSLLLRLGCNLLYKNKEKRHLLSWACEGGNAEVVKWVIKQCGKHEVSSVLRIRDSSGRRAEDYCKDPKLLTVVRNCEK